MYSMLKMFVASDNVGVADVSAVEVLAAALATALEELVEVEKVDGDSDNDGDDENNDDESDKDDNDGKGNAEDAGDDEGICDADESTAEIDKELIEE